MGIGADLWLQADELTNKQDIAGLGSLFTSDGRYTSPAGSVDGAEAIGAYMAEAVKGLSDIHQQTSRLLEDGDTVMAEWTCRFTVTGPMLLPDGTELSAAGKTVLQEGVSVATIKDGKFSALRDYFDQVDMMKQMGLMPGT